MSVISKLYESTIDHILPPRCPVSGDIVDTQGMISPHVWKGLVFISDPVCESCGYPMELDLGAFQKCKACQESAPPFAEARAALAYNDMSRDLILKFKHGDRTDAIVCFLPWLKRAGRLMLERTDVIIPVPLHWRRLWGRRYNQSAMIAQALALETGKAYAPELLRRVRATLPQGHAQAGSRTENVAQAFEVPARARNALDQKSVLLIDDVYTTGATLRECTKTFLEAGAKDVRVLTLARVVKA